MGPCGLSLGLGALLLALAAGGGLGQGLQYDEVPDDDVETFQLNLTAPADADAAAAPTPSTARKCCPPGLSMYRVNAPGCDNQVTCKITDSPSSILWSLQPGSAAGQYGFPTSCPRERCHLVLLDNATEAVAEARAEPYCVDHLAETDLSGQVVDRVMAGMACVQGAVFEGGTRMGRLKAASDPSAQPAPASLVPFRKCCPVHQWYDLASRACVGLKDGAGDEGEGDNAVSSTWAPAADYDRQQQAVQALFRRVFHKNLTALVDMSVGPPECERPSRPPARGQSDQEKDEQYEHTALLDVAVFDVPWDEQLADEHGVLTLWPAALRGVGEDPPWRLSPGDYCVDDAGSVGTLAVKACLGAAEAAARHLCQRFGCFRKCCPHHEYFKPVSGGHACVPRPATPDPDKPPLRPEVHDPPAVNLSDPDAYVPRSAQELVDDAYQRFVADQRPHQVTFSSVVYNVCPDFRFRLDDNSDVWFFDRMGAVYQPSWPDIVHTEYCLDDSEEHDNLSVLVCLSEMDPTQVEENTRISVIAVGLLISCLFLALTLLTYCCLPALQNLHGKTLMCHVSSLLVAYLILALTQMLTKPVFLQNEWICTVIGNCVLFTFLSAFSWLNVMCFDIWRTFGGMTSTRTVKRSSASRRFRWYCAYAWGLSSLITVVCITVDQWPGNDKSVFRPQIGDGSCWFRTEPFEQAYGILIFFVGPLLVQTCSNVVLFVLTVLNYSRIKSEITRMHTASNSRKVKKFQADSNKLKMNVKLFVVMGVTWVLELVSTFFPREHAVFYLSDAANALQGVMIFAIFVLKRKVMRSLAVRLGRAPPPAPYSANPSVNADCRLATGLAVRGKTTSTNTLFTSDFRSTASRVETAQ